MGNKLRSIFCPSYEERVKQRARIQELFNEAAKNKGCATCKKCVEDKSIGYLPNFVTAERNKCLEGLRCDTVLFSVKNCPRYEEGTI